MAERLKDRFFTQVSMNAFAEAIRTAYPGFDTGRFKALVFDESFEAKEVKDRMIHTTQCLRQTLPGSYPDALEILEQAAPRVRGFEALCLPHAVEGGRQAGPANLRLQRSFVHACPEPPARGRCLRHRR